MAGAAAEDIRKHIKVYIGVFVALAVLTVVTVLASHIQGGVALHVGVAMVIAVVKGSLVACYFMHLISERKMLYGILALCAIFFFALLFLPVVTHQDMSGAPLNLH